MSQPLSLVRFSAMKTVPGSNDNLYWGRVSRELDGIPFRGAKAPVLKESEFEAKTGVARYYRCEFFDMEKPEDRQAFQEVMNKIACAWFDLMFIARFRGANRMTHYVEWVENYNQMAGTAASFLGES